MEVWLSWHIQSSHLDLSRINLKALSNLSLHLILTWWAAGAGELFPFYKRKTEAQFRWSAVVACPALSRLPGGGTFGAKIRKASGKWGPVGYLRYGYRTCHITWSEMSEGLKSGLQTLSSTPMWRDWESALPGSALWKPTTKPLSFIIFPLIGENFIPN